MDPHTQRYDIAVTPLIFAMLLAPPTPQANAADHAKVARRTISAAMPGHPITPNTGSACSLPVDALERLSFNS